MTQISNNFYSKQCTKCRESKEISDFVKGTNLCKEEEQRKCFNFNNLQPLWAKENLEKSDK